MSPQQFTDGAKLGGAANSPEGRVALRGTQLGEMGREEPSDIQAEQMQVLHLGRRALSTCTGWG